MDWALLQMGQCYLGISFAGWEWRMTVMMMMMVLASSGTDAVNNYCVKNQYFWYPDGSTKPATPDWSSYGKHASFVQGPCTGVSGIGMTVTYKNTAIIIDRSAAQNGYMYLKDLGRPKDLAYAQEIDLGSFKQRPLDVITNTFCSSGQHTSDGSLLSIGGDWSPDYATPGEFSIRQFSPCTDKSCGFKVVAQLARSRWYPTTALLADGRTIVVGGSSKGVGLNQEKYNVPYVEYYPKPAGNNGEAYQLDFLNEALPYNLFPYVHVLPSGKVFIFASHKWMLWDANKNLVVPGNYPEIAAKDEAGYPLRFSYPTAGTSAMLPLTSATGYAAEVIVCGGSSTRAIYWAEPPSDKNNGKTADSADYPATKKCFRILPDSEKPEWVEEEMAYPRVMPVGVLLPDGHLLILSGTGTGHSGLGQLAHKPSLVPEMYNTETHSWFKKKLPASRIPRGYHSSAVLVRDGSVFVSGSNPNSNIVTGDGDFPTEFRTEFFHPPYMGKTFLHPKLIRAPATVHYGTKFTVSFRIFPKKDRKVHVVLAQPGFSTHGANHGMRNVVLDVVALKSKGVFNVATVQVPDNKNLLPPTWYWLFVVVNGIPNQDGYHCFVKAA